MLGTGIGSFASPPSSLTRAAPALISSTAKYGRVPCLPGSMFVIAAPCSPADLCRVILERAGVRLELPPEQRAPELLAPLGVVRRDLDVHDLTWQRCLLVSSFTAMPPSVVGPRGHVKLIGRRPDAGPPGYFRTRDRISLARSRRMSRLGRMRAGKDWRWRPQPRQFHQRRRLLPGPAVLAAVRRRTRDRRYGQCTQSRRFSRPGDHLAAVRWGTQIIHSVATWRARPTLGLQYRSAGMIREAPTRALLQWFRGGSGVVSGPGTRPDSRSGRRRQGCPVTGVSAGSQSGTHRRCRSDLPGLCKRPGFTGPTASGCVPSLNHERDGYDHHGRRHARHHRRRGHAH